jgi:hypothetical protein
MSVQKRRRQAISRRRWVTELVHRHEDRRFYEHGTIPPSATAVSLCSCGARAFSREEHADMSDFDAMHAYCDDEAAS